MPISGLSRRYKNRGAIAPVLSIAVSSRLPPINRSPRHSTRGSVEVIVIASTFCRQRRAGGRHRRAGAINRNGNGAAGEVRHAPTRYVGRHPEAIGTRRIEAA